MQCALAIFYSRLLPDPPLTSRYLPPTLMCSLLSRGEQSRASPPPTLVLTSLTFADNPIRGGRSEPVMSKRDETLFSPLTSDSYNLSTLPWDFYFFRHLLSCCYTQRTWPNAVEK